MRKSKKRRSFKRVTSDELAVVTREFDAEFSIQSFEPLDSRARARWAAAKRKRGRPKRGRGAKAVSVTIERTLLQETDRLAKQLKVSRAALIECGLRKILRNASG